MVELPEFDHALQKTEKSLTMYAVMMHSASRRIVPAVLIAVVLAVPAAAQEFAAGEPIGALNEAGVWQPMSDNVTVYGSFHFSESCTFDSNKNLILAMNTGNRGDTSENDGFVSLINPDGSVHTPKWIGATRDGLELYDPLGSAISNGVLYTVDVGYVRLFDLETGRPLRSIPVPESTILNGIAVADDGTVYASNEEFGIPTVEAMACGTPVVVSKTGALPELAGDAGLLVDPGDPEEMADAIYRMWTDDSFRREMARRAGERSKQFSWDKCARQTLDVLESVGRARRKT